VIPRDEIVTSFDKNDEKTVDVSELFDFSQLGSNGVDGWEIDAGVTSGSDTSEWEPIAVDSEGRVDTCANDDNAKKSKDPTAPAVCESPQSR
jgi:hypothetical protein